MGPVPTKKRFAVSLSEHEESMFSENMSEHVRIFMSHCIWNSTGMFTVVTGVCEDCGVQHWSLSSCTGIEVAKLRWRREGAGGGGEGDESEP